VQASDKQLERRGRSGFEEWATWRGPLSCTSQRSNGDVHRFIDRVTSGVLKGQVQCMITDMILRGVHQAQLMRRHGIVTITKVAAASPSNDDGLRYVLNERGKRVKTLPLVSSLMIGATGISVTTLLR
jgi:hypothetical protein